MAKQKVLVLYGGRSTEHEISCRSASFIFKNIDQEKYEVIPVGITKQGRWCLQDAGQVFNNQDAVTPLVDSGESLSLLDLFENPHNESMVVIPVLHGSYGEDGCTQGLLELKSLAYVGPGVLGSAIAMDKVIAKKLVALEGVPVVPSVDFRLEEWQRDEALLLERMNKELKLSLIHI